MHSTVFIAIIFLFATTTFAQNITDNSSTLIPDNNNNNNSGVNITCAVTTNNQLITLLIPFVSLVVGALSGMCVTQRAMNSVCIKGATVEGNQASLTINSDIVQTLEKDAQQELQKNPNILQNILTFIKKIFTCNNSTNKLPLKV